MTGTSIGWKVKCFYGLGQAAESIKTFGFGTLLLLYYNQVLGLSGTYSGIAVFIAIAADAISDPAVGSWSDGFRHALGRRHLFMYLGAVPLGLTYYFLFWPPEGLSEFQLFLWFTTFAVLSRTALTFFHVPYLSLGAEMSLDYQERTQIVALRTAFGMVASLIVVILAWNFFFVETADNSSPQLERVPYFRYAMLSAVTMTVMMLISTWGTTSVIPHLTQTPDDHPPFSMKQVYRDLYDALKTPAFFALFWGSLVFMIYAGVHGALSMHVYTF
ncbi:MAG: MFS transporter, partial [Pseudomonadota bacterium]